MSKPCINPAVLLFPSDVGYVAYDPVTDRLHELNPVASLIAEFCDGTKTLGEIQEILKPLAGAQPADVERWIEQATGVGLVIWTDDPQPRQASVQELSDLADRLTDRGEHRVAFLCCRRITEITPDDPEAWYALGDAAWRLGRSEDARTAYSRYLDDRPEDAAIRHLVIALGQDTAPSRAPDECIRQIYGRMAAGYDALMREHLEYRAPERLRDVMDSAIGARTQLAIADLGCGSGMAGIHFRNRASQMVGVDLSPEMVALARTRGIYDQLEIAEISGWLRDAAARFDVILACECLVYFGSLQDVVSSAARRLLPDGVFGFTVEKSDQHPFILTRSGRYAHHVNHIREVAKQAGLTVACLEEGDLRLEYGEPVAGFYVVLQK